MPQAPTGGAPSARRRPGAVVGAGIFAVLLIATWMLVTALVGIDPRGRESWRPTPLAFDASPRDVTLFVPGCDVEAVGLQPAEGAAGAHLAIATFSAAAGDSAPVPHAEVTLRPIDGGAYVLPLTGAAPPWRAPLILRVRTAHGVLTLADRAPITFVRNGGPLGTFVCAFDGHAWAAWGALATVVLVIVAAGLMAAAWAGRALQKRDAAPATPAVRSVGMPRSLTTIGLAVVAVGSTVVLYQFVVPPFEPPDELAHLQYARYIAATGSLPAAVPPHDSEWRASSYEWVQQPLYYVAAAAALRVTGWHLPGPQLTPNPRSRLQPRGTEPTIFQHAAPSGDRTGHRALALLRGLSLLMALATTWLVARLARTVTDDPLIVATVAGGLALVPQWCAVMGAVSTDPPATLLAAAATLGVAHVALGRVTPGRLVVTGTVIGAAYAVKATAAFLIPMAGLACLIATIDPLDERSGAPAAARSLGAVLRSAALCLAWLGAGVLLAAGWIPLRAYLLYGDPLAFEFKRAILEAGGFVPARGPMPWTAEFWTHMRVMVFEPFWARFGSLGAGPLPGSKVWLLYAGASGVIATSAAIAVATTVRRGLAARRGAALAPTVRGRCYIVGICLVGVAAGLAGWIGINLVPRADMVVHWTPRHILPLTAPAAVLVAAGLDTLGRRAWTSRPTAAVTSLTLVALAIAYLLVLRATVLTLHFGY